MGRPFSPEDAAWIDQLAGGLPCFVQKAAMLLYEARDNHNDNQAAARESTARAFMQWADHHYHYYWQHFTDEEREALSQVTSGRDASLSTFRAEHGTDAVDGLVSYGILSETDQGYQVRGGALERWFASQTRPARSIRAAQSSVRLNSSTGRSGALRLEAAQVAVLAKAIELLFEQGHIILEERRERRARSGHTHTTTLHAASSGAAPLADEALLSEEISKADALSTPIRMSSWSTRESEVKHLVSLLEIQTRNYFLAKEQLARWGSSSVPPVVVTNLEEAENSVAETATRLNVILNDLYRSEAPARSRIFA
jgi:hypothetical protein